jgi:hypothetical protein
VIQVSGVFTDMWKARALTLTHMQFTLRGMMIAVAVTGLILGFLVWLSGWVFDLLGLLQMSAAPGYSQETIIDVGPSSVSSNSAAFWPILFLGLALLAGVVFGFLALVYFAAKAIRHGIMHKA